MGWIILLTGEFMMESVKFVYKCISTSSRLSQVRMGRLTHIDTICIYRIKYQCSLLLQLQRSRKGQVGRGKEKTHLALSRNGQELLLRWQVEGSEGAGAPQWTLDANSNNRQFCRRYDTVSLPDGDWLSRPGHAGICTWTWTWTWVLCCAVLCRARV